MASPPDPGPLSELRAVLFDLDGTLVETHIDFPGMMDAMRALSQTAGVSEEVIQDKDILAVLEVSVQDVMARGGDGAALRREAFAQLETLEVAGCAHPTLLPGAEELLRLLKSQERKIGIVTRNCRRVSQMLVERFGLPCDVLLTRDDVRRTKPDPQHLWDALAQLGNAPGEAAMVGDHWMDIQAGRAAGCAATLGVQGAHEESWFAPCPPTHRTRDLAEALPLFGL
ncbi:MAG: HAD family hydrolase [Armatimonadota bacterium]|nr:HAD family hydrolase [Armatimonadota bacterium]